MQDIPTNQLENTEKPVALPNRPELSDIPLQQPLVSLLGGVETLHFAMHFLIKGAWKPVTLSKTNNKST